MAWPGFSALTALDTAIAESEIGKRHSGRTTRAAVAGFQAKEQLPATGRADRATAEAISRAMAERLMSAELRAVADRHAVWSPKATNPDRPGITWEGNR